MKEYIKKFANPASVGDNYSIASIPFMTSVETTGQNLVCNETGKKLVRVGESLVIQSAGPEMVDLGLSVKWAKYNIGATGGNSATDWYGGYYAWGETETKEDYSWLTYKHTNGNYDMYEPKVFTKYMPTNKPEYWNGKGSPDNKLILDAMDDVVNVELGGNYRMPTKTELEELIALPNQFVTNYNGVSGLNGCVFTGKNSNTLFIPAAGYFDLSIHGNAGANCYLWSSSLDLDDPHTAWYLNFHSGNSYLSADARYIGCSVRAVKS